MLDPVIDAMVQAVIPLSSPVIPIRITKFYSALCFFGMAAYRRPLASRPCATVTRFILFHRCQSLDELFCRSVISGLKWRAVASVPFRSYPTHALPLRLSQGSIRAAYDSAPRSLYCPYPCSFLFSPRLITPSLSFKSGSNPTVRGHASKTQEPEPEDWREGQCRSAAEKQLRIYRSEAINRRASFHKVDKHVVAE